MSACTWSCETWTTAMGRKYKPKLGRPAKEDRSLVRDIKIDFDVTEHEREDLNDRSADSRFRNRAAWIRYKLGLPLEPDEDEVPL